MASGGSTGQDNAHTNEKAKNEKERNDSKTNKWDAFLLPVSEFNLQIRSGASLIQSYFSLSLSLSLSCFLFLFLTITPTFGSAEAIDQS